MPRTCPGWLRVCARLDSELPACNLGDPEIQDFDQSAIGHHDVAGFEVAMHDTGGVGRSDGVGNLYRDGQQLAQRHAALDTFGACSPFDPFHGDEIDVRLVPDFVDRDDVGVVERARRLRFANQASAARGALPLIRRENFEGDRRG